MSLKILFSKFGFIKELDLLFDFWEPKVSNLDFVQIVLVEWPLIVEQFLLISMSNEWSIVKHYQREMFMFLQHPALDDEMEYLRMVSSRILSSISLTSLEKAFAVECLAQSIKNQIDEICEPEILAGHFDSFQKEGTMMDFLRLLCSSIFLVPKCCLDPIVLLFFPFFPCFLLNRMVQKKFESINLFLPAEQKRSKPYRYFDSKQNNKNLVYLFMDNFLNHVY